MDKNLQQLYGGIPRNSIGGSPRLRQNVSANYSSISGRKSLGGSAVGLGGGGGLKKSNTLGGTGHSSRFSISGRSNQSVLGVRSEFSLVESYGYQLPVLVNEALTFSEKQQQVSVRCAENGWAWLIHGRRLLVWQYKDVKQNTVNSPSLRAPTKDTPTRQQRRTGAMAQCRELILPHCDIGHKASLVNVFLNEGQQMASCVAVSPTGDIRYWPSIAHDGSSVDLTNILDGQEFDFLLPLPQKQMPLSYLMVTTTCSLILLQLQLHNSRNVLQYRSIRQPAGFLGGIGKKFASIIIGINSVNERESKFVAVTCENSAVNEPLVTVLADRWIQCWRLSQNSGNEQLLFEDINIIRKIRDEFHQKFWNVRDGTDVRLNLLGMQAFDGKIYILAGAVNISHTPQMHYAIAVLTHTDDACMNLENFVPLKYTQFYNAETDNAGLTMHFIICHTYIYIYNEKIILPLSLSNMHLGENDAERVEFHLSDDRILCAAVTSTQLPLFFSRTHGLVSVTPSDLDSMELQNNSNITRPESYAGLSDVSIKDQMQTQTVSVAGNQTVDEQNLYMFVLDPDNIYNDFKDDVSQMKAAFIYRLKNNINMSNTILNTLLGNLSEREINGSLNDAHQLDKIIIKIAEDLAEDIPAADPRWEEAWDVASTNRHALGSSSSMQILTQLKEKNLALKHFIEFLHNSNIWEKLEGMPNASGNTLKPTSLIISDISEKIIGAVALRTMQNNAKYNRIIDEAITLLGRMWKEYPQGQLTTQDLFYVRIGKFQEIFQTLCDLVDSRIQVQHQSLSLAGYIADINAIILNILNDIMDFRAQNRDIYMLSAEKTAIYEYLPWTAMSGSIGVRDAISHLIDTSVKYGVHGTSDPELKPKLYQQILELIDIVLDGRKQYLNSIRDSDKYKVLMQQFESQRRALISLMIDDEQYEYAAKLAEKYLDFQSLIIICDITDNQQRLDEYIKKFEEYDFSQFAINWHLRQNRQGEVFERFKSNQAALMQFMRDHPTLGWIQLVFNGDFERASRILFQLAQNETEFIQRKKTMLSLAKLSACAAADSDMSMELEAINIELTIIDYQEQLSVGILQAFGYDIEQQRVLQTDEIINLYIAEENEAANEFDFRKALELLNYMEEPYEIRHKIWCAAILRDNWTNYDTNNAIAYLQNLLFVKLIELCHLMEDDLDNVLPSITEFLNSSNLGDLVQNKSFQYLLKLIYEYINNNLKSAKSQS